jgi:hypothetical protein
MGTLFGVLRPWKLTLGFHKNRIIIRELNAYQLLRDFVSGI